MSADEGDTIVANSQTQAQAQNPEPPAIDVPVVEEAVIDTTAVALDNLPRVEEAPQDQAATQSAIPENANPSRSGMFRKLRADIPSLSGVIRMQNPENTSPEGAEARSAAASPRNDAARASLRKSGIPSVTQSKDEAVDYDMEVPVFDDAQVDGTVADEADVTAASEQGSKPGQVEIPSTRAGGFVSRLKRKSANDLEETPQEWLDVDDDFDARSVGRARGSWESFRDDSQGGSDSSRQRNWQGGGFSRVHLDYVDTRSTEEEDSGPFDQAVGFNEDRVLNEEIGQIIHFRNPLYDTEIWFAAIGSDTELHDGAKAFIEEHRSELRGAMVIEIESLGAGVLSVASEEGRFRTTKASSRVKRFTKSATEATGITLDEHKILNSDSITTTVQKAGFQAMHLFGAEDGRPALKASADDVAENVDELILEENVSFLMELLKQN